MQRREARRRRDRRYAVEGQLDPHGLFASEEAERAVLEFINRARSGHRCVRIVRGKGRGSATRSGAEGGRGPVAQPPR